MYCITQRWTVHLDLWKWTPKHLYNLMTVVALIESGRLNRVYHSYPGLEYPQIITQIQSGSHLSCVRNSA